MEVAGRQEFPAARLQPTVSGVSLALGAVPVSAGVVGDGAIPATRTLILLPAECGSTAALDGRQDFAMLTGDPPATALDEF